MRISHGLRVRVRQSQVEPSYPHACYNRYMTQPLSAAIKKILTPAEACIFDRLNTPESIQTYLDALPLNFEDHADTYYSPRLVLQHRTAHCFEGALLAAAALAYHGKRPLLMDFQTIDTDTDHVVALFQHQGLWGALSKTNHSVLRYRDAVYRTPRELAMSYFHEYFDRTGHKSLRAYSVPFTLSRFAPERWITSTERLGWLAEALDKTRHYPTVSHNILASLPKASHITRDASQIIEWRAQGVRAFRGETDRS